MCNPLVVPILTLVVTAAGTYASMKQSEAQAKDARDAQQSAADAQRQINIETARQNAILQNDAASKQIDDAKEATAQEQVNIQKQRQQLIGSSLANAAAAGVQGLSIDQSLIGLYDDEAQAATNTSRNLQSQVNNINANLTSTELSRMNAIQAPTTTVGYSGSSGTAALFQFAGQAAKAAGDIYDRGYDKGYWGKPTTKGT